MIKQINTKPVLSLLFILILSLTGITGEKKDDLVKEGEGKSEETLDVDLTVQIEAAVDNALKYLSVNQNPGGSYGRRYPVAETSLVCLAFLSNGSTPKFGKYKQNIIDCVKYLLASASPSGFISDNLSRMHGHAFATLCLSEVYGMTDDTTEFDREIMERVIIKAIDVIESGQTSVGGWGYTPNPSYDEGSVTICQIHALRAARNAGFKVDNKVIVKALHYVENSANRDGSFRYSLMMKSGTRGSGPLTAAALSTLNFAGVYNPNKKIVIKGLRYLRRYFSPKDVVNSSYFFYGQYYASIAMYYAGDKYWNDWYEEIAKVLLDTQDKKLGTWYKNEISIQYSTAMATLILQVPYGYLPILQR